jgi:hypothetical protein
VTDAMGPIRRIWFLPHEYWQITKEMSPQEVDHLMHEVESLAAAKNFAALSKYPFIFIGEKCHRREETLAGVG